MAVFENYDGGAVSSWSTPAVNGVHDADLCFQTFTPEETHTLSSVKLYLRKIADSPTVNFIAVQIQPTDGAGQPTGNGSPTALTNVLITSGDIEQTAYDWKWVEFDLGGDVSLTNGTTYAIEFYYQANTGTDPIQWAKKAPDTNYPRGQIWHWVWGDGDPYAVYPGEWLDGTGEGDFYFQEIGTSVPSKATNPTPTDTADNITLDHETITWEDGGGADTYNVYYGTTSGALSLVSSAQAGTSFTIWGVSDGSPYDYLDIRYWRIDSTNEAGTTTGDEWMFTTIPLTYPNPNPVPPDPDNPYPPDHAFNPNFINTTQRLICAANSKVWYEV